MIEQFIEKGIEYKELKNDIAIKCPFHEHSQTKYHLNISNDGKKIHCWVCGWGRGKNWNHLAAELNLKKMDKKDLDLNNPGYDFYATLVNIDEKKCKQIESKTLPYTEELLYPWRRYGNGPDIPISLLEKIGARRIYDEKSGVYRLLLPVVMHNKLMGWASVWNLKSKPYIKVINSKGVWASKAFFPFDYVRQMNKKFVFIVEGQYDALRLILARLPALCVFGVENWNIEKMKILEISNFNNIYIMCDADEAGYNLAEKINNDFKEIETEKKVKIIGLPPTTDPGDLTDLQIKKLKKYISILNKRNKYVLDIKHFDNDVKVYNN